MVGVDANGNNLNLGRGRVYFDRFTTAGASTGERFLGNCSSLTAQITPETVDAFSSADKSSGLLARSVIRETGEFSIEFMEYDAENMALAILGDTSSVSQLATPVVDETVATAGVKLNRWYQLAKYDVGLIANFSAKKGATSLVGHAVGAFVANDDYAVDLTNGRIMFMAGTNAVTDGDTTLKVSYTPLLKTYATVRAGTTPLIYGKLVYISDNVNGPNRHVEVWKVQMGGDGEVSFIGDDFGKPKLKGAVLNDAANHPTEPYWRDRNVVGT